MEISKLLAEKAKKEEALKRLQQELLASEKKIKRIHSEEKILEEKSRFKKIIAAPYQAIVERISYYEEQGISRQNAEMAAFSELTQAHGGV